MTALVAALAAAAAALLPAPRTRRPRPPAAADPDWMRRHRWTLCALAGLGGWLLVGGPAGPVAAAGAAAATWRIIATAEPVAVRRRRERVRADLPQAVRLFAGALAAGAPVEHALRVVGGAVAGPVGDMFTEQAAALALGTDPATVWASWSGVPETAALGRTLARAQTSGMRIAAVVDRLADEAVRDRQAAVENRARAVGVRAAIPLGVCFLPAFVLVGIVPQVGSLIEDVVTPTPATGPVAQP